MQSHSNTLTKAENCCYQQNIYFLQHKTLIEYLPDIFRSGFLKPRAKQNDQHTYLGGSGYVAYVQPYKYRVSLETTVQAHSGEEYDFDLEEESGNLNNALLLFSVKLLEDRSDYYANKAWNYGVKDTASVTADEIKKKFYTSIESYGEICFPDSIDLSKYLVETWVHPIKKDDVRKMFKIAEIDTYKISSYAYHPKIKLEENLPRIVTRDYNNIPPTCVKVSSNLYKFFDSNSPSKGLPNIVEEKKSINLN